jgi:RNase P protein component
VLNELVADDRELPQGALLFIAHTSAAGLSYPELRTQVEQMMENIEKSRVSER